MGYSTVLGKSEEPFQIFIGPRGTGKTYPALEGTITGEIYEYLNEPEVDHHCLYLRRTQSEVEKLVNLRFNPYKSIMRKHSEWNIEVNTVEKITVFEMDKKLIGYGCALSTFTGSRGADFSDVDVIIYDEFIPEKHVKKIKAEAEAFFNLYETISRNRELEGRPPLRCYFLANAISLANPILLELGMTDRISKMIVRGEKTYTDHKRGIYVELMENREFRDEKEKTALYKLTKGTTFAEQALNNKFGDNIEKFCKKVNLNEYYPILSFNIYTIFQHKHTNELYICEKESRGVERLDNSDADIFYYRFAPQYRLAILSRRIYFDEYSTKLFFDSLTDRKILRG